MSVIARWRHRLAHWLRVNSTHYAAEYQGHNYVVGIKCDHCGCWERQIRVVRQRGP